MSVYMCIYIYIYTHRIPQTDLAETNRWHARYDSNTDLKPIHSSASESGHVKPDKDHVQPEVHCQPGYRWGSLLFGSFEKWEIPKQLMEQHSFYFPNHDALQQCYSYEYARR